MGDSAVFATNLPAPCDDVHEIGGWKMRCVEPFGHEGRHGGPAVHAETSTVTMYEWAHPGEPAFEEADDEPPPCECCTGPGFGQGIHGHHPATCEHPCCPDADDDE